MTNTKKKHKRNVTRGYIWLRINLPKLFDGKPNISWQIDFNHDQSKYNPDEYAAYDAYFYGGNRSHAVVEAFQRAWLLHLHRNPHHWQYWVLNNDEPDEGEVLLEIPYDYIYDDSGKLLGRPIRELNDKERKENGDIL